MSPTAKTTELNTVQNNHSRDHTPNMPATRHQYYRTSVAVASDTATANGSSNGFETHLNSRNAAVATTNVRTIQSKNHKPMKYLVRTLTVTRTPIVNQAVEYANHAMRVTSTRPQYTEYAVTQTKIYRNTVVKIVVMTMEPTIVLLSLKPV